MYFIEKILRFFYKKPPMLKNYRPTDIDTCEHVFYPIDSSCEYLACSKCGKLIKKEN